jgi:hypothetical protein
VKEYLWVLDIEATFWVLYTFLQTMARILLPHPSEHQDRKRGIFIEIARIDTHLLDTHLSELELEISY